jgi:hypothetical protein
MNRGWRGEVPVICERDVIYDFRYAGGDQSINQTVKAERPNPREQVTGADQSVNE